MRSARISALALAVVGFAPDAGAGPGMFGSRHDFSAVPWNTPGDYCTPCHAVMGNPQVPQVAPLWNHKVTTSVFVLYSSSSLNAVPTQPQGRSLACLSCHDGTVSLDAYGSSAGTGVYMTGSRSLGTDLSSTHPISFTYDDALAAADRGLFSPTTSLVSVLGGTIAQTMLYGTNHDQLECTSCHNVHDDTYGKFLRITQVGSALCLTCHNK